MDKKFITFMCWICKNINGKQQQGAVDWEGEGIINKKNNIRTA